MRMLVILLGLIVASPALALQPGPNDAYVRVVDVGPALCTVTEIPGQYYMVYDAGHWTGDGCLNAVRDIVDGERIDLLIISHSDSDHLGEADNILAEYSIDRVIWTGFPRWDTANWRRANDAIAEQVKAGASVWNLQTVDLEVGKSIPLGDATVTLVAGWPEWTDSGPTAAEKRNAISLVVRLDYQGRSVLFTGDTVGRRKSDPDTACKDAEKVMVDRQAQVPIASDVLIAPHHGGDNASATCFIQAIDPTFVIFPAGHSYDHPSSAAAQRYIDHGIPLANIFRTDRGDDEGGFEWGHGRISGCSDGRGDDGVGIVLTTGGTVQVDYRHASSGC